MSVDASLGAAFDRIAARERDSLRAFIPGAQPENDDVALGAVRADFTLDPLSVALPENSYALVRSQDGRVLYTRDASFSLRNGTLVDAGGQPVQGYVAGDRSVTNIRVDAIDASLRQTEDLRLEADGSLTYERNVVDPRTGRRARQRVVAGRIALARFTAGTSLPRVDAEHVRAPNGVAPHVGAPNDGSFAALAVHRRESAQIDLDASIDALREAYLSLDALTTAHRVRGDIEKTTMDLLK